MENGRFIADNYRVAAVPARRAVRIHRNADHRGIGGMQVEDISIEGLRRSVDALDDLETVAALKQSP